MNLDLGKGDIFGHCLRTADPIYAMAAAVTGGISGTRYIYIYTWTPKDSRDIQGGAFDLQGGAIVKIW